MKSILIKTAIIIAITYSINSFAQTKFPNFECENLEGKTQYIPKEESKRYQLLVFTFGKSNEKELTSWLQPIYDKFIAKTGMLDFMFDAEVNLISVLNTLEASAANANREKIKKEIDPDLHPHVYNFKGDEQLLLNALNMKSKNFMVLLLDPEGNVVYKTSGKYSEDKMEALEDAFDELN